MEIPVLLTSVDRASPTPIFEQIRAILEKAIASGALIAHRRIPSERELSAGLGVSRRRSGRRSSR